MGPPRRGPTWLHLPGSPDGRRRGCRALPPWGTSSSCCLSPPLGLTASARRSPRRAGGRHGNSEEARGRTAGEAEQAEQGGAEAPSVHLRGRRSGGGASLGGYGGGIVLQLQ